MKRLFRILFHTRVAVVITALLCVFGADAAHADDVANFVTYGPEAGTKEGDDDFTQVIYFFVPADVTDSLWLRIYDPDCGGNHDSRYYKTYDTRTRFSFYGGEEASTYPGSDSPDPVDNALSAGTLLFQQTYGDEPFIDKTWQPVVTFSAARGENLGDSLRAFKLVVQGLSGDDANIYNAELSRKPKRSAPVAGVEMFTFEPSIRLPWRGVFAEMKFHIPDTIGQITVHNFDLTKADMTVETKFRSSLVVDPSGQDEWINTTVELIEREKGVYGALAFEGGEEMPNDATFFVTTESGNTLPIELPIRLRKRNHRPTISYDIEPLGDCRSMLFDASRTFDEDNDPLKYAWFFGDSAIGTGMRTTYTFDGPGDYYVELIVSDESGHVGNSSLEEFLVHVNYPPEADAGIDLTTPPRRPLGFDASNSSDTDNDSLSFSWSFGDGEYGEGEKPVHSYENPGRYTVVLHVEDNSGQPCNHDSDTLTVWVNARPLLNIGPDRTASPGDTLTFAPVMSQDLDGEIVTHRWDMGDGTTLEGDTVRHSYAANGAYTVICTSVDNAGTGNSETTDTLLVHVNEKPVAAAGGDKKGAAREEIQFDASNSFDSDGRIIRFEWDFGDGYVMTGPHLTHVYTKPGEYSAVLTVQDDSRTSTDTDTDTINVFINQPPVAVAGPDTLITASELQFDGTQSSDADGEIIEYRWQFGDGATGRGPAPTHIYRNPGVFTVTLTVKDNSGTSSDEASDQLTVEVNHQPLADAGPSHVVAPGQSVTFSGGSSIDPDGDVVHWEWDFGDGTTSETPEAAPVEEVKETEAQPEPETVPDSLLEVAEEDTTVAADSLVVMETEEEEQPEEAPLPEPKPKRKPGGTPNPTHTYTQPGQYTVLLTVRDNTGHEEAWGVDETYVTVNEAPVANAGGDRSGAPGVEMTFSARRSYDPDGEIVGFYWDFSDGEKTSQGATVKRTFDTPGLYTATLTVLDNAGVANSSASDRVEILINSQPVAKPGPSVQTCQTTLTFDASGSFDPDGQVLLYTWDFGDDTPQARGVQVTHTYRKGGKYPVTLTVDDGMGLKNSVAVASLTATINQPPIASAGGAISSCAGEMIFFDGSLSRDPEGGPLKYSWDFGDGTQAQGMNPAKRYERGGTYQVVLTVEDASGLECNRASTQLTVTVGESPVADAGPDIVACANSEVHFDGTRSYDSDGLVNEYHWDFGDGSTRLGPTPAHTFQQAGEYRVLLTVTGDQMGECDNTSTDELLVTVYEAPGAVIDAPELVAKGDPVTFNAGRSSSGGATITGYEWNYGDGHSGDSEIESHAYEEPGVYYVSLTVTTNSEASCNRSAAQQVVKVNARPEAIAGDDRFVGIGQDVIFDASRSRDIDGAITKYMWDFGDGTEEEGIQVRHRFESGGDYPVVLHVIDNTDVANNWDMDTVLVAVNRTPAPTIEGPFWACVGEELSFTDATGSDSLVSWQWDFGDGNRKKGRDVTHSYRRPGTYLVTLLVNDGKKVSNSLVQTAHQITVNDPPVAVAGKDIAVSPGKEVTFDGSGSHDYDGQIQAYHWAFGDGTEARGEQVTHTFAKTGLYTTVLTVTDNAQGNCTSSTDTVLVKVNTPPEIEVGQREREAFAGGANDAILFDASASTDPDGDPLTFLWEFGDGSSGSGPKVRHAFAQAGVYRVKLTVDDGTGLDTGVATTEIIVTVKER